MKERITDGAGRLIGYLQQVGSREGVLDSRGQLVGWYANGQTFNAHGQLIGRGDQRLRLLK